MPVLCARLSVGSGYVSRNAYCVDEQINGVN